MDAVREAERNQTECGCAGDSAPPALRNIREIQLWGGLGKGELCALCAIVIPGGATELEIEAERDGAIVQLHFHPRCYSCWKAQRATGRCA
jgi:hypothetical protein